MSGEAARRAPDDLPSSVVSKMRPSEILDEVTASLTTDGGVVTTRSESSITGYVKVEQRGSIVVALLLGILCVVPAIIYVIVKWKGRQDAFSISVVDRGAIREVAASGV